MVRWDMGREGRFVTMWGGKMRCARRNSDEKAELGRTRREVRPFTEKHSRYRETGEGEMGRRTAQIARNPTRAAETELREIYGERT